MKSLNIARKEENIQGKLKSSLKDSILSFQKIKPEQMSFQGIDGVPKTDERVVTFTKDSPARGTVRYIGKEVDSAGNVYIVAGLELVGIHNFLLNCTCLCRCRVLLKSKFTILTQNY